MIFKVLITINVFLFSFFYAIEAANKKNRNCVVWFLFSLTTFCFSNIVLYFLPELEKNPLESYMYELEGEKILRDFKNKIKSFFTRK